VSAAVTTRLKDGRMAVIRPAVAADAEGITDLVNIVGAENRFARRERATWTIEEERQTIVPKSPTEQAFFVAEVGGKVCGLLNVARGQWSKDRHVASFGMACLPECRRLGLGTALLIQAIDWARVVGVRKLTLEVFATNENAIALYRKLGFEEEARLRGQFMISGAAVDSVLMARWL
jgi:ribosomal protein S18 acetylase RimI-like enzyme